MKKIFLIGTVIMIVILAFIFIPPMGYSGSLKDNATCDGCDVLTDTEISLWHTDDTITIVGKIKFEWTYWQGAYLGDEQILISKGTVILTAETDMWEYILMEGYNIYPERSLDRNLKITLEDVNIFDVLGGTQKPYPPRVQIT